MVNSKKKPSYKLISTYKTELMGVASISVLIGHAGTAIIADTGVVSLINSHIDLYINVYVFLSFWIWVLLFIK